MCRQFSDLLAEYPIDPNDKITSRITPRDHTIVIYVKLSACQSHCERDSVVMSVSFVILSLGFDSELISGGNTFTQDRSIAGGLRRLHTDRMIRRKIKTAGINQLVGLVSQAWSIRFAQQFAISSLDPPPLHTHNAHTPHSSLPLAPSSNYGDAFSWRKSTRSSGNWHEAHVRSIKNLRTAGQQIQN